MTDEGFREMVEVYKQFYYDEISRSEAKDRIGEEWPEVSQVASMELCREGQQKPTDEELRQLLE